MAQNTKDQPRTTGGVESIDQTLDRLIKARRKTAVGGVDAGKVGREDAARAQQATGMGSAITSGGAVAGAAEGLQAGAQMGQAMQQRQKQQLSRQKTAAKSGGVYNNVASGGLAKAK